MVKYNWSIKHNSIKHTQSIKDEEDEEGTQENKARTRLLSPGLGFLAQSSSSVAGSFYKCIVYFLHIYLLNVLCVCVCVCVCVCIYMSFYKCIVYFLYNLSLECLDCYLKIIRCP